MTREQILNAFYLAIFEAGLADSNAALKLDCYFQKHLDEIIVQEHIKMENMIWVQYLI